MIQNEVPAMPEFGVEYDEFQTPCEGKDSLIICLTLLRSSKMHSYVISDHELKKGFTVLNELLEKDPEATEAQFGLAKILFYMGRLNEAIAMMEKIVSTKTPDSDYLLWASFMAYI